MRDFEKEKLISEMIEERREDLQKMTDKFIEEVTDLGQEERSRDPWKCNNAIVASWRLLRFARNVLSIYAQSTP